MGRTLGELVHEARVMLNDPTPSLAVGASVTMSATATLYTLGAAITEARAILNDTDPAAYRYPDADLYTYLNNALVTARRFRPDLFERGGTAALPVYAAADAATLFPLDEGFFPAFVQYVAGAAETRDDTTAQEQEAQLFAQGFMANLQSLPHRYSDTQLYAWVSHAVDLARTYRPDLFHGRMALAWPTYTPADAGTAFPMDERYFRSTVDFVVGRARRRGDTTLVTTAAEKPPAQTLPDHNDLYVRHLVSA